MNDDHARAARGALFLIAAGLLLFNVLPFGGDGQVQQRSRADIGFQELSETGPEEVCEYWVETEGPLYVRLRHNFSCTFTGYETFLPATQIEINSKGFRGPPIANDSPAGTERVFMLGDSFTFGWGVNRTDSYPYLFEQMLNNSQQQYQVINAGVPGYGMRDYYEMLDHSVSRYDPDHIVVTFTWTDVLDKRTYDQFLRGARAEVPEDASNREQKVQELFLSKRETYLEREQQQLWDGNSTMLYYMDRIVERAHGLNSSVTFYAYMDVQQTYMERLQEWSSSTGVPVIRAPDRFDQLRAEQYQLTSADEHYNSRGNRILARTLYEQFTVNRTDG